MGFGFGNVFKVGADRVAFRAQRTSDQRADELAAKRAEDMAAVQGELEEINERLTEKLKEAGEEYEKLRKTQEMLVETVDGLGIQLAHIPQILGDPDVSAGGILGAGGEDDLPGPVTGVFHATGDIRLTANVDGGDRPGWVPCDGRELAIDEYRPLYRVIGQRFGPAADPDTRFAVPEPTDLTGDSTLTNLINDGKVRFEIRI